MRVMLCQPMKHLQKIIYPAYAQQKADGARIIIYNTTAGVKMFTRNGKEYTKLPTLAEAVGKLPVGYVYDGELLFGDLPRKTSNGLARKAHSDGKISVEDAALAHVKLWDTIPVEDYDRGLCAVNYKDRFDELLYETIKQPSTKIAAIPGIYVESEDQAIKYYEECLEVGLEGIVLKNLSGVWEDKRSYDCVKMKAEKSCELRIYGWKEHSKNPDMIGALCCKSDDGAIEVAVGSGLNDYWRYSMFDNFERYIGKICEVHFNQVISAANKSTLSLFLPTFKGMRPDKDTTSTVEEIINA